MPLFKKLLFAPLFLISLAMTVFQINGVLNVSSILSFDLKSLIPVLYLVISIIFTSFFFAIFVSLSQETRLGVAVALLSALIPFIFLPLNLAVIFAIGSALIFNSYFFQIMHKLKTYLTFSSQALLFPSIKQVTTLLIIMISLTYYLSINKSIEENGFEIPDSILESALNFSSPNPELEIKGEKYIAQITQEQLDFLKQNPQLLESQGVDPKLLEQVQVVTPPSTQGSQKIQPSSKANQLSINSKDITKKLLRDQLNKIMEPYKGWVAPFLSLMFFITLTSLSSLLSIIFYPLLPLVFWVLEKSNFIHFEKEMREVRKLVV